MEKHNRFSQPLHGFSLRTLLIATTLVAVVLGLIAWSDQRYEGRMRFRKLQHRVVGWVRYCVRAADRVCGLGVIGTADHDLPTYCTSDKGAALWVYGWAADRLVSKAVATAHGNRKELVARWPNRVSDITKRRETKALPKRSAMTYSIYRYHSRFTFWVAARTVFIFHNGRSQLLPGLLAPILWLPDVQRFSYVGACQV